MGCPRDYGSDCHLLCRYWVVPTGDIVHIPDAAALTKLVIVLSRSGTSNMFGLWDKVLALLRSRLTSDTGLSKSAAAVLDKMFCDGKALPVIVHNMPSYLGGQHVSGAPGSFRVLTADGSDAAMLPSELSFTFSSFKVQNWATSIDRYWDKIVARMQMLDFAASYRPLSPDLAVGGDEQQQRATAGSNRLQQHQQRPAKRLKRWKQNVIISDDSSLSESDEAGALNDDLDDTAEQLNSCAAAGAAATMLDVLADVAGAAGAGQLQST